MKNKNIGLMLLSFVLVVGTQNLFGMSYYYRWRLGNTLVKDARPLGNDLPALQGVVNKDYSDAKPLYVKVLQSISPKESDESYVRNVSPYLVSALKAAFYRPGKLVNGILFFTAAILEDAYIAIDKQYDDKGDRLALKQYFESQFKYLQVPTADRIYELENALTSNTLMLDYGKIGASIDAPVSTAIDADTYTVTKEMAKLVENKQRETLDALTMSKNALEGFTLDSSTLYDKASPIWLVIRANYIDVFQEQIKLVRNLTRVSAIERWYKNRMIKRLLYLYNR